MTIFIASVNKICNKLQAVTVVVFKYRAIKPLLWLNDLSILKMLRFRPEPEKQECRAHHNYDWRQ